MRHYFRRGWRNYQGCGHSDHNQSYQQFGCHATCHSGRSLRFHAWCDELPVSPTQQYHHANSGDFHEKGLTVARPGQLRPAFDVRECGNYTATGNKGRSGECHRRKRAQQ